MKTEAFIELCLSQAISFSLVGDKLKIHSEPGSLTEELLAEIKSRKQELLVLLQKKEEQTIFRRENSEISAPLSFSQQRLWLACQIDEQNAHYNMTGAIRIKGLCQFFLVEKVVNHIFNRHEILRTNFCEIDTNVVQIINDNRGPDLRSIDAQDLPERECSSLISEVLEQESLHEFSLVEDTLMRFVFIKCGERESVMVLNMHHIIADAHSLEVITREFVEFYDAFSNDRPPSIEQLPVQYADFAHWQRNLLDGDEFKSKIRKRLDALTGIPEKHALQTDKPRQKSQNFHAEHVLQVVNGELFSSVKQFALANKVTEFTLLQSVFALFLSRYSGERDIVMGVPYAGRQYPEVQSLVGFFVNLLVFRNSIDEEMQVGEYIAQARKEFINVMENQDVPFDLLVDKLNVKRSMAYNPVCQIKFMLEKRGSSGDDLAGFEVESIENPVEFVRFDLDLSVTELKDRFEFKWLYKTALFESSYVAQMAGDFQKLLSEFVSDPSRRLMELEILDSLHKDRLDSLSEGPNLEHRHCCLTELFEEQVLATPDNTGLRYEGTELTYLQLNTKVNRLADFLRDQGVEKGEPIAVFLDKSPELIVALFAVLKSGARYIPLDIHTSKDRLRNILSSSEVEQVLTKESCLYHLPTGGYDIVLLDGWQEEDWKSEYSNENYNMSIDSGLGAYIVYTSGSTGVPKGVEISNANLADYCQTALNTYYTKELDGSVLITSHAFDITVPAIFLPLISGGAVEIPCREKPYESVAAVLQRDDQAHLLRMTPSNLEALFDYLPKNFAGQAPHVFVIGGEGFPTSNAKKLHTFFPYADIYNHYGPSELTVGCVYHKFDRVADDQTVFLPIGLPMPNHQVYVVDERGRVLPQGAKGELLVSGAGVASGYIGDPELTASKFVMSTISGEKCYTTGDMVRWDRNGKLEFIGRKDSQIKLRGYRIEPAEIEKYILGSDGVESCLVRVLEHESGLKSLVAYVVSDYPSQKDREILTAALRTRLAEKLPTYMVPDSVVLLEAWPLSPSGKVDRAALPAPTEDRFSARYERPETTVEIGLADLWAELLNLPKEKISRRDQFFSIGGNSLLAIRLIAKIRDKFSIEVKIKDIFDNSTLDKLARLIELGEAGNNGGCIVITKYPESAVTQLSYAQQRLWFIDQLAQGSPEYNIVSSFDIDGDFDVELAEECFRQIIARHAILRTFYRNTEDEAQQVVQEDFHFNVDRLSYENDVHLEKLVGHYSRHVFDLTREIPIRVAAIQHSTLSWRSVLVLNIHHIAIDGWSMRLLLNEFSETYTVANEQRLPNLPQLEIDYKDYARWQIEYGNDQGWLEDLDYWRVQLADVPPVHNLPLSRARPDVKQGDGALYSAAIEDQNLVDKLNELAHGNGMTPFMLVHAALSLVLSRHSNTSDIVIGTPVANRDNTQLESLIGFFVNTLVLRVSTDFEQLDDYLSHVRDVHIAALEHQKLPFEQLVDELNIIRTASHTPLFQVLLTTNINYGLLDKEYTRSINIGDVFLTPRPPQYIPSKFDLEVEFDIKDSEIHIHWIYDTAIFEEEAVATFSSHMKTLLYSLVSEDGKNASKAVNEIVMLSDGERDYLVNQLNETVRDIPYEQCLQSLFIERVKTHASKTALIDSCGAISYEELFWQAYGLSRVLRDYELQAEELVAVKLKRGREQVIAVLGILMAGAAYLPIEYDWPEKRCRRIIDKSRCRLIIIAEQEAVDFGITSLPLKTFQSDGEDLDQVLSSTRNLQTPSDLAYVIFTSGSTGEPKGVAIEHRSAVNTILDVNRRYQVGPEDKVFAVSALSFDLSVYDIFGLLAAGGEVVIPEHERAADPAHWLEMIERHQVTIWDSVPASAGLLAEQLELLERRSKAPLRHVLMSGDWIDPGLPKRLWCCFPGVNAWSMGGATEGSIWSINYPITSDMSGLVSIPYGKPLSNQKFYILDDKLALVPPGIVGELCISGVGVARCYYNDPSISADRFVFHAGLNEKIYRTGDLGRYMPDGNIEFIGRKDAQVKLNGFRIELGEIEKQIAQIDEVDSALVKAIANASGTQSLVAYVRTRNRVKRDLVSMTDELKMSLRECLPGYMVPTNFVFLDSWPLTPNGKVDVKALPAPGETDERKEIVPPTTEVERIVTGIWSETLNIPESQISTQVSFFELNGNSLMAMRLLFRVNRTFNLKIELRNIYKYHTVKSLALLIDQRKSLLSIAEDVDCLDDSEVEEITL